MCTLLCCLFVTPIRVCLYAIDMFVCAACLGVLQDEALRNAVESYEGKNWKQIASAAFGTAKSDIQCLHRWQKVLKPGLVKVSAPVIGPSDMLVRRAGCGGSARVLSCDFWGQ